ncbi:hypothetical protein [Leptospira bandrabouensis]|uniref:hypothetical protein n=1 Tax=Leptospira bandrabouensis TaxID=2484903 RepID=UPI001EE7F87D|nr:hypothetical protein [Leptospira bandrabouensis]MCG6143587.1 hypothetical protein [Leptospira bandrabouensis]MCG6159247.1 hypothetical protein [Leptospira bandrabouensis]MCG6163181.1 hypothetical protein [Leptospira bandrabouensis]
MKPKIFLTLALFLLIHFGIFANPETKANELCECLKKGKTTENAADKKSCLSLREKHVSDLKKGSKSYESYLLSVQKCEQSLAGTPEINPNLNTNEKISAVCDCFQKSNKQSRMGCFKLQSDYGKTISDPEEKKEFNLSSGSCE